MPKLEGINKVLIIGSGAIKIGEAGEFDYSGAQAIKALKEEGIEVVLVNPNVATIQTDKKFVGERTHFIPIIPEFVEKVIEKEKPDSILLGFGGQTALNCGTELEERGALKKYGVKVLGTSVEAIERADNRDLFRKTMLDAGIPIPNSKKANTIEEAVQAAEEIGYPVMVRVAYTLGGQGTGAAFNEEDLRRIAAIGLAHSRISQILIEEYVGKWKEIEYEVLRDHDDNSMIVCSMENFDPMGVHTGDSIVIAPSQTVSNELYQKLKATSFAVLRALDLIGECNIQFAVHPKTEEFKVIEVNSRLSRSSALASKATGYPIAYATAKIALGYRLSEIRNKTTNQPAGSLEPDIDYIVVKMPRWDFQKFKTVNRKLGTQMKSVGEVMAIAKTFEEALQKAVRMLDIDIELTDDKDVEGDLEKIKDELANPTDRRIFYIIKAFKKGITIEEIYKLSGIDPFFLEKMKNIVDFENALKNSKLSSEVLKKAKRLGFSDKKIGKFFNRSGPEIRKLRNEFGIIPFVKQIKTAKRWSETAKYLYFTYNSDHNDIEFLGKNKTIVLGSGCYRIGASVEFDWCCVNMAWALKDKGIEEVIMINCNPETVSTDFDVLDKLYFEELTLERVLDIVDKEKPDSVVVSVGGQIANNLAMKLKENGINILGTSAENIDRAEDRSKFSSILDEVGIAQPRWSKLENIEQAKLFSKEIGYPVLIRPSYVLSGSAMKVVMNDSQLKKYLGDAVKVSKKYPVVISKFITSSKEVEIDGVCDGKNVFIGAIIEHVEKAGVHSGDATMSVPSLTLPEDVKNKLRVAVRKIARKLEIKGPFNIQFLVKHGRIYVIECNLRSSRSMPFVSKTVDVNLMELAADALMGKEIIDGEKVPKIYGVKSPQFSFMRLEGADPVTNVEMVSTGEVACFGKNFEEAFLKSLIAGGFKVPIVGEKILISSREDNSVVPIVRNFINNGFEVLLTKQTKEIFEKESLPIKVIGSEEDGKGVLDYLTNREVKLVINIPSNPDGDMDIDYLIRRRAVEFGIPVITNIELAKTLVRTLVNIFES